MASLLYYKNFRKSLQDEGYEFNPYDPCVANNLIKDSHMNVYLHVDYCKLSHNRPKLVGKTIKYLKQEHERIFEDGSVEMTVYWGKIHNYLRMKLD